MRPKTAGMRAKAAGIRAKTADNLSGMDRRLLALVQRVVPEQERDEWVRAWYGELWHAREHKCSGLVWGLLRDAIWLRCESWRSAHRGTAGLCVAALAVLCLVSMIVALVTIRGWEQLLNAELFRFMLQTPLIVLVAFATSPRRHIEQGAMKRKFYWVKRQIFLMTKTALILMLAFLVSIDLCQPMRDLYPMTAGLLQIFCFVFLALLGLRWSFQDQHQRCKQCLRCLETPARVGRPSHNLLEWNGTELLCRDGHGLLNVPEMETSWCQASRWSYQGRKLA